MPYYGYGSSENRAPVVPHGPDCGCSVCGPQRVQNTERLTSTDRLAWLEKRVLELDVIVRRLTEGKGKMGVALWCQTGAHAFDENDENKKRIVTDRENRKGDDEAVTIFVCGDHVDDMFKPKKQSLKELQALIAEADEIGE